MEDHSVWPPPPTSPRPPEKPPFSVFRFLRVPALAFGSGLALALFDITTSSDIENYLSGGMAAILGYCQPAAFWLSAFTLTECLYIVHLAAIAHGVRPPFVESDINSAMYTWYSLPPNAFSGLVGAITGYLKRSTQ